MAAGEQGLLYGGIDLADAATPLPEKIGPYQLLDRLGQSKSGVVLDASHPHGGRVALKVARPPLQAAERHEETARLLRELSVLKALHHPGVIKLVDTGLVGGLIFLAVQRIEGVTLRTLFEETPADLAATASIGVQVGSTLSHLHEVGVLQRELTPDVVIVGMDGRPVLADFGFSTFIGAPSITEPGPPRGTLAYVAPEIFDTGSPSTAADQYALGRLLYELAVPQSRSDIRADQATHAERQAAGWVDWSRFPGGAFGQRLQAVIKRMLDPDPDQRYPDVHTCVAELAQLAALQGIVSLPAPPRPRPAPRSLSSYNNFAAYLDQLQQMDKGELHRSLSDSFSDVGAPFYATAYILMEPEAVDRVLLVKSLTRQAEAFFRDHGFGNLLETPEDSDSARVAEVLRDDARVFWEDRAKDVDWNDETPIDNEVTSIGHDTLFEGSTPMEMISSEQSRQTILESGFQSDDAATLPPGVETKDGMVLPPHDPESTNPPDFLPVPDSGERPALDEDDFEELMHADTLTAPRGISQDPAATSSRPPSVYVVPADVDTPAPRRRFDATVWAVGAALLMVGLLVGYFLGRG